jgi:hypothetical protein
MVTKCHHAAFQWNHDTMAAIALWIFLKQGHAAMFWLHLEHVVLQINLERRVFGYRAFNAAKAIQSHPKPHFQDMPGPLK